ncbi:hypothetical protein IY145_01870 [Methylosinus sp. H3A]|uniref:hypothetical protein n=1 Tax=Hyphomicrobiales TaxID=356 RepID=UPI0018C1D173|nr:hypothetical protein [Methylosinus sp. H3A]MBG0808159.1 hypothetical protein [Methylosinus sp. H3A]
MNPHPKAEVRRRAIVVSRRKPETADREPGWALNLENVLCKVNPDCRSLHGEWLLQMAAQKTTALWQIRVLVRGPSTTSGQDRQMSAMFRLANTRRS